MRLNRHTVVHTAERPYPCGVCSRRFRSINNLQQHMLLHTGEKRYSCHYCGKRFAQHPGLSGHLRTHRKKFPCDQCDKGFHKKQALEKHIRSHDTSRRYQCAYCELRYESKRKLIEHLKRHSEEIGGGVHSLKKIRQRRNGSAHKPSTSSKDEDDSDVTVVASPPCSPNSLYKKQHNEFHKEVMEAFDVSGLLPRTGTGQDSIVDGEGHADFASRGGWTFGLNPSDHWSDENRSILLKDALLTALGETTATVEQMVESAKGLGEWLSENKLVSKQANVELEIREDSLDCGRKYPILGTGSLAEVKIGLWGGSPVAVKTYSDVHVGEGVLSDIVLCRHPNIIAVYGVTEDHKSLVMELTEGNIAELITGFAQTGGVLSLREKVDLARGCLQGLNYLHRIGVVHGSIRPSNVLVNALMVAKLADVMESSIIGPYAKPQVECRFIAPELPRPGAPSFYPTKKGDIFSLGQTLLDLFSTPNGDAAERLDDVPHPWLKVLCRQMTDPSSESRLPLVDCLAMMATVANSSDYKDCPPKRTLGRIIKTKKSGAGQNQ